MLSTAKTAVKYGLVEDNQKKLRAQRTWAHRYDERAGATNPYDDPNTLAEDEFGRPIVEPSPMAKPAAPMPSTEDFQPASARDLDRRVGDDDESEEFYNPDFGTQGDAPGAGEVGTRNQSGAGGRLRKAMTGTNNKDSKRVQKEGRERFEREQANPYSFDGLEDDFGGHPSSNSNAGQSRQQEFNSQTLAHDF